MEKGTYTKIKSLLDFGAACLGVVVLFPFLLVIALFVKLTSPGPVFFTQERVGKDGKRFRLYKFRTMAAAREEKGDYYISESDGRISQFGRFLRRWSIDEMPQLVNILKGDMSLVGPRPTLPYQVECYSERQRGRLLVKPGLTGWAQVNGRNTISWPDRIEYDLDYVRKASFFFDLKIILKTPPAMLSGRGLYGERDPIIMGGAAEGTGGIRKR